MPQVRAKNKTIAPMKTISIEHLEVRGFDKESLASQP
jgi:hypothetical protein